MEGQHVDVGEVTESVHPARPGVSQSLDGARHELFGYGEVGQFTRQNVQV